MYDNIDQEKEKRKQMCEGGEVKCLLETKKKNEKQKRKKVPKNQREERMIEFGTGYKKWRVVIIRKNIRNNNNNRKE